MSGENWIALAYIAGAIGLGSWTRSFVIGLLWPGVLLMWLGAAVCERILFRDFDR